MSDTQVLPLIDVRVLRENHTIPTQVFEHEIAVLEHIHGPDRIEVIGDSGDTHEAPATADAELLRLQSKYDSKSQPSFVAAVFPTPDSLADAGFAAPERGTRARAAPQAAVVNHAKAKKKAAPK